MWARRDVQDIRVIIFLRSLCNRCVIFGFSCVIRRLHLFFLVYQEGCIRSFISQRNVLHRCSMVIKGLYSVVFVEKEG